MNVACGVYGPKINKQKLTFLQMMSKLAVVNASKNLPEARFELDADMVRTWHSSFQLPKAKTLWVHDRPDASGGPAGANGIGQMAWAPEPRKWRLR